MTNPLPGGRARYGVDGWPYVVGLGAGGGASVAGGVLLATRRPTGPGLAAGLALSAAGLGALTVAGLGLAYTLHGKHRLRDRLLEEVTWRGDEVVLDVGAGAGLLGIGAAHRAPLGRVHCVDLWIGKDLSGNSADRLRHNALVEGVADRVDARRVDARELDLPDGAVDVVLSTLCLHNLGDSVGRRRAAAEIARVLRPGGTVVVSDLAGTDELAGWFAQDGLVVDSVTAARATFPPQRVVIARRP